MFRLIHQNEKISFPPVQGHVLSMFKGKGNALCTEYAVLAQNILCFLGYKSYFVMGRTRTGNGPDGSHAFNLIAYTDYETKEPTAALIDFGNQVFVLDERNDVIGFHPYFAYLEDLDQKFLDDFLLREKHLQFSDYNYCMVGDELVPIFFEELRDYYASGKIMPTHSVNQSKVYSYHNNSVI